MSVHLRVALVGITALTGVPAQQLQWQVPASGPSTTQSLRMMPFGDYDHDSCRDFLRLVMLGPVSFTTLQIASGLDGSTLWTMNSGQIRSPGACDAGDVDGDGTPDLAVLYSFAAAGRRIDIVSPSRGQTLWQAFGPDSAQFGNAMLGNLDVDGDGRPDFVTVTTHTSASDVYVYSNAGDLLYTVPCLSRGLVAISLAKMGDLDGDGCDDFVVGCNDLSSRGLQMLLSGKTGAVLRETFGLLPGDKTSAHISNLGDIDGDGVDDYAAFPYWSTQRLVAVAYSGATGAVIRSWTDYANSVVTGEDFDQDGVNDIVTGADWGIAPPNVYGSTRCVSGRDGTEIWRIDNFQAPFGTGHNGSSGWMESSASLGVRPSNPYPVVAWMDINWVTIGTYGGRTRAYSTARAGQGPVTGTACTSSGTMPLIGVRAVATGSRITLARSHPNALAALNLAFTPLPTPVDLAGIGFAGCTVYVEPTASYLRVTGSAGIDRGYGAVDLPHPLTAAAIGTDAVGQWLVFEPATLGHAATQMHGLRLQ